MKSEINLNEYTNDIVQEINELDEFYEEYIKDKNNFANYIRLKERVFDVSLAIKSALVCHSMTEEKAEELRKYIWGLLA